MNKKIIKKRKSLVALLFICFLIVLSSIPIYAAKALDQIHEYQIVVEPRADGSLDISYHIEWEVLDDKSDGPLEWVKIGIPNKHVDSIVGNSDCIDKIDYYSDGGSYIRIDFNQKYYAGDVVTFDFSIHQSWMSFMADEEIDDAKVKVLKYTFVPGWFNDIEVNHIEVRWNKESFDVLLSDAYQIDGNYLVWETSLDKKDRLTATIEYPEGTFPYSDSEKYYNDHEGVSVFGIIGLVFLGIIVLVLIIAFIFDDGYGGGSGGGGIFISGCASSSSCASSCACACACAGGGRAGCSTKEFYQGQSQNQRLPKEKQTISREQINKVLDEIR